MIRWVSVLVAASLWGCSANVESKEPKKLEVPSNEVWLTRQQIDNAHVIENPLGNKPVGGTVITSGRVTFDDMRVAHVFSPVTGRITQISSQPGQRVKRGDALAVIDSPDVGQAFSDLAKAHAGLDAVDHEYTRQKELFEAHAGSQRDFENAKSAYAQAQAEFERAQRKARLLNAGTQKGADSVSQDFVLRAPIEGEIIARTVNPGMEVQGQYGGGTSLELFTIGELDTVWVLADVFEMDLGQVKTGSKVAVKVVAFPNRVFQGVADWVSGSLDPLTRTARVRCRIENPDHALKPEMFAQVSIAVDPREELAVPRGAVLRLGDQMVVFVEVGVAPDGRVRFERRPVVVDESLGGDFLPLQTGVKPGEKVVEQGAILLSGMVAS
jgi:cobalt-zinc-cadmium efflux system membrane fusion protein